MESILAAVCVVSLLAAMTAWSFAWKINRDWQRIMQILEKQKTHELKEFAAAIKVYCGVHRKTEGCAGCEFLTQYYSCGIKNPTTWDFSDDMREGKWVDDEKRIQDIG